MVVPATGLGGRSSTLGSTPARPCALCKAVALLRRLSRLRSWLSVLECRELRQQLRAHSPRRRGRRSGTAAAVPKRSSSLTRVVMGPLQPGSNDASGRLRAGWPAGSGTLVCRSGTGLETGTGAQGAGGGVAIRVRFRPTVSTERLLPPLVTCLLRTLRSVSCLLLVPRLPALRWSALHSLTVLLCYVREFRARRVPTSRSLLAQDCSTDS